MQGSFQMNPWKNDPGLSLGAAVRDDRLDNDREVGSLGRERHGKGSTPVKTPDNEKAA